MGTRVIILGFPKLDPSRVAYNDFLKSVGVWETLLSPHSVRIIPPIPDMERSRYLFRWSRIPLKFLHHAFSICYLVAIQAVVLIGRRDLYLVTSDGVSWLRPFIFNAKRVICFWWNSGVELEEWAKVSVKNSDRLSYLHFVTRLSEPPALPKNHVASELGNFCLAELKPTVKGGNLKRLLFVGSVDVSLPRSIQSAFSSGFDEESCRRLARRTAMAIVKSGWGHPLARVWADFCCEESQGNSRLEDSLWNLFGNHLRYEFLESIASSELQDYVDIHATFAGVEPGNELRAVTHSATYATNDERYTHYRVVVDFGSRWVNNPAVCYERTTRIVTSGFGLLRYSDVPSSPLFDGLNGSRQFTTSADFVTEAQRMIESERLVWQAEGQRIRDNYQRLLTNQARELRKIIFG